MDLITVILIAVGLSIDAVAVAVSLGLSIGTLKIRHGLLIGLFFGIFQAIMPVIGWAAGWNLKELIAGTDHWIAFGLLTLIGIKMIYESLRTKPAGAEVQSLSLYLLCMLSVATSIDALAIGVSFAFLDIAIVTPVIIIGAVTFFLSFLGVGFGRRMGYLFQRKIEAIGGIILIGIGLKILLDHLGFLS